MEPVITFFDRDVNQRYVCAMSEIIVYTDGAALGNPGPGGYGVVMMYGQHRKELSEGFRYTTNNRMELLAVIMALRHIKNKELSVLVNTDSKYVCDAISKRWLQGWVKKNWKNVKNTDLWKEYIQVSQGFNVKFNWVKGHAGIVENERCDFLATEAAKNNPTEIDANYEQLNPR
jgi:ribonuclease HI